MNGLLVMNAESPTNRTESAEQPRIGGQFGWLINSQPRRLLLPITGLWVLGLDWLLFSSNSVTLGLATPWIVVIGFVVGGAGTFFLQKHFGQDPAWKAALKALVIGALVGAPWPLAGTLIGGWVLLAAGLGRRGANPTEKNGRGK